LKNSKVKIDPEKPVRIFGQMKYCNLKKFDISEYVKTLKETGCRSLIYDFTEQKNNKMIEGSEFKMNYVLQGQFNKDNEMHC